MILSPLASEAVGNLRMHLLQGIKRCSLLFAQLRRHRDRRGVLGQLQRRAADQAPCIVAHWHADQLEG
ncbi:hypothetical protein D3C85_1665160 [compost metagenome]